MNWIFEILRAIFPNHPPTAVSSKISEDRLAEVYRELMSEMRWRRDQDTKYLTVFFTVVGFALAGMFIVLTRVDSRAIQTVVIFFVPILIRVVGIACKAKITAENVQYSYLGKEVVRILDRWNMIESKRPSDWYVFPESIRSLGIGDGFKQSTGIIDRFLPVVWLLAAALLLTIHIKEILWIAYTIVCCGHC